MRSALPLLQRLQPTKKNVHYAFFCPFLLERLRNICEIPLVTHYVEGVCTFTFYYFIQSGSNFIQMLKNNYQFICLFQN